MSHPGTLVLIMAAAVLATLLAESVAVRIRIPLVIFEIVLGILLGPDVLGWVHPGQVVDTLSDLGLAMLIFLAGYEIEFAQIRGGTLRRALWAWLISITVGIGLGFAISGGETFEAFAIGTVLTSTALGTVLPLLRDSGDLHSAFGRVMSAFGAVGEFGPIVAITLLLSGRRPGESAVLLVAFAVITAGAVLWAVRPRPPWFSRLIDNTLHSSGQFAVRFVMLVLAGMLGLSQVLGLDILLGAFAAGMLTRLILHGAAPEHSAEIVGRVEALGFGFLVPLFYIVTGIEFDLDAPAARRTVPAARPRVPAAVPPGAGRPRVPSRPARPARGRPPGPRALLRHMPAARRGHHDHRRGPETPRHRRDGGPGGRRDDLGPRTAPARRSPAPTPRARTDAPDLGGLGGMVTPPPRPAVGLTASGVRQPTDVRCREGQEPAACEVSLQSGAAESGDTEMPSIPSFTRRRAISGWLAAQSLTRPGPASGASRAQTWWSGEADVEVES
ncbi:hypothetical protein GCM10020256_12240 [Streptomyces thermocoprophilus]